MKGRGSCGRSWARRSLVGWVRRGTRRNPPAEPRQFPAAPTNRNAGDNIPAPAPAIARSPGGAKRNRGTIDRLPWVSLHFIRPTCFLLDRSVPRSDNIYTGLSNEALPITASGDIPGVFRPRPKCRDVRRSPRRRSKYTWKLKMVTCPSRASARVVAAVTSGLTPIPLDIGGHGVQQDANYAEAGAKTSGPPGPIPAALCARDMRRKQAAWMARTVTRERLIGCPGRFALHPSYDCCVSRTACLHAIAINSGQTHDAMRKIQTRS